MNFRKDFKVPDTAEDALIVPIRRVNSLKIPDNVALADTAPERLFAILSGPRSLTFDGLTDTSSI